MITKNKVGHLLVAIGKTQFDNPEDNSVLGNRQNLVQTDLKNPILYKQGKDIAICPADVS